MGRVNVADFKARTFAGQTARPKGREAALVGDFRQRVGLVHELRQLRRAEECTHRRRGGFGVDQVLRHDRVDFHRRHAFLDRTLHAQQTDAILIIHQFANRAHPAVAEVVDVVNLALAVTQFGQRLDAGHDIGAVQRTLGVRATQIQTHVHLDAADGRQIVTLAVKEQRVEKLACSFDGRRFTRAHDAVDVHKRGVAAHVLVCRQSVADVGADVDVVDVENRNVRDALIQQRLDRAALRLAVAVIVHRQFVAGFSPDLAGFFVDDVLGHITAHDVVKRHQKLGDRTLIFPLLHHPRRGLFAGLQDDLTRGSVDQIIGRAGARHAVREELGDPTFVLHVAEADGLIIGIHDAFLIHAQRVKQRGHRQFAATVDPREHDVLGVELKVQP